MKANMKAPAYFATMTNEALAAQAEFLAERGAAESKAQDRTNKAVYSAAIAFHAERPNKGPVDAGKAILAEFKRANEKAPSREQVPASRISRALKSIHIEGWTEEGKGLAIRTTKARAKDSASDLLAKFTGTLAQYVEQANTAADLDKIEQLFRAAIASKRQALTTK
jgi:hypothetical protein